MKGECTGWSGNHEIKSDFSNLTDNFSGFPSISATLAESINLC